MNREQLAHASRPGGQNGSALQAATREVFVAMAELVPRMAQGLLNDLAAALRVVIVNGPRQSGKTTLLKQYQLGHGGSYRTLDNRQDQEAAVADPVALAAEGKRPRLIDEVNRGGEGHQDGGGRRSQPGPVHTLGIERFLTVPTLSEPLAGRAVFLDLWPLSVAERTGGPADFFARLFDASGSGLAGEESGWTRDDYIRVICVGDR